MITTNFCTYHDSTAVVVCEKICRGYMFRNWIITKYVLCRNSIFAWKSVSMMVPSVGIIGITIIAEIQSGVVVLIKWLNILPCVFASFTFLINQWWWLINTLRIVLVIRLIVLMIRFKIHPCICTSFILVISQWYWLTYALMIVLTHWGRVMHIYISKLFHHWFI